MARTRDDLTGGATGGTIGAITGGMTGGRELGARITRKDLKHDNPQTRASSSAIVSRIIELEILPGLAALHPHQPRSPRSASEHHTPEHHAIDEALAGAASNATLETRITELTAASLSSEPSHAFTLVAELFEAGATRQAVFGELLAGTARRLGEMWERDACSFVDVTVGLNRLHQILREHALANPSATITTPTPRSIFLMPAPGEQHIFGMLVLADHFRSCLWRVDIEFSYASPAETLALLAKQDYGCIGFTISNHRCTDALTNTVSTLRNSPEWGRRPILVGGSLYDSDHELVSRVGADGGAHDEIEAIAIAETFIDTRIERESDANR